MHKGSCESVPRTGQISIANAEDRSHWANAFGVTEPVLLKAVKIVGTSVRELRKLFCLE